MLRHLACSFRRPRTQQLSLVRTLWLGCVHSSARVAPPHHHPAADRVSNAVLPRHFSASVSQREQDLSDRTEKEITIYNILKDNLQPVALHVADISGGCGAMFSVYVASPQFEGVSMVKQHRMVYDLLREEIPAMHGLSLQTKTPAEFEREKAEQTK